MNFWSGMCCGMSILILLAGIGYAVFVAKVAEDWER